MIIIRFYSGCGLLDAYCPNKPTTKVILYVRNKRVIKEIFP